MTLLGLIPLVSRLLRGRKPSLTPGHADRLATLMSWAIVILAAVLLAWLTISMIRRDAVDDFNDERLAGSLQSERRANVNADERNRARREETERTEDQLEDIHAEDPEGAAAPASRGSRAVARRLRDN